MAAVGQENLQLATVAVHLLPEVANYSLLPRLVPALGDGRTQVLMQTRAPGREQAVR